MTRTLILMRHAKSSWDDPLQDDFDRTLNARGRASATALGNWLRQNGHLPDQVLCSSAHRTRETLTRLDLTSDTEFSDRLYLAGESRMMRALQNAHGQTVLMLGHNPGIAGFAEQLVAQAPAHPRFHDYPTCATLVVSFDIEDWQSLRSGTGQVIDFVIPREIIESGEPSG